MTEWVRLELDLASFDAALVPLRPLPAGVEVSTLAGLGDSAEARRQLYELNKACSGDIPGRGPFFGYDEYSRRRFDTPAFRPDGQIIALQKDEMIGMCALSHLPDCGWALIEMTGVVRPFRRRGLATRLKVDALTTAKGWGVQSVRTLHHQANLAIIAANRKLGFVDSDFALS